MLLSKLYIVLLASFFEYSPILLSSSSLSLSFSIKPFTTSINVYSLSSVMRIAAPDASNALAFKY